MIILKKSAGIIFGFPILLLLANSFQHVQAEVGSSCTASDPSNCTTGEECLNNISCSCKAGYTNHSSFCTAGNGYPCNATNGCSEKNATCDSISNTCKCTAGYTDSNGDGILGGVCKAGNGYTCDATNGCSEKNATCDSTSNTCKCTAGYTDSNGDGILGGVCKAGNGYQCDATNGCSDKYATCTTICKCTTGYTDSNGDSSVGGVCNANVGFPCDINNGCSNTFAVCNDTCKCRSGYYNPSGDTCTEASMLAVRNLTITSATENSLVVQWEAPGNHFDVSSYKISWKRLNQVGSPGPWYTDVSKDANSTKISSNLTAGAAYTIMVSSYQNSTSQYTVPINYSTRPFKPGPLNESTDNLDLDVNGLTLVWNYNGTLNGVNIAFKIEIIDTYTNATIKLNDSISTTVLNIPSTGLKNGYKYIVKLTAQSEEYGSGLRINSEIYEQSIKTVAKAPGPPGILTCYPNDVSIKLTWSPPDKPNGDIVQYWVETYNYSNKTLLKSENTSSSSTIFEVQKLNPGSPFQFKVYTENEVSRETNGSLLEICSTVPKKSDPPQSLETSDTTSRNFKLTWKNPVDVFGELVGYMLRITRAENNSCVVEELTKCQSECTYNFPNDTKVNCTGGLPTIKNAAKADFASGYSFNGAINNDTFNPDTTYTVSLEAINQGGRGSAKVINVTTKEEVPQKPSNLTVTNIRSIGATVAWTINGPRPGKTNYTIRLVADNFTEPKLFTVLGFLNTSFELYGLEEYWHYSLTVEASTSIGSNLSDPVPLQTAAGPAGQVSQFRVGEGSGSDTYVTARVSWSLPEILQRNGPISSFFVQQEAVVNGTFSQISYNNVTKVADENYKYMNDFQAEREKLYRYTVFAFNGFNGTASSMNYSASALPAPGSTVGALAGGIAGGAAALILIVVVFVLWRRKHTKLKKARRLSNDATESNMENLTKIRKQRPINLSTFAEYVADYHKDSNLKFSEEYDDLKTLSPQHAHEAADMEENRLKNRFVNILPFDHSRVRLLPIDDVPGSDYINANYLPGFSKTREYIACQGPIPATIDDHWRLIWEQNVRVIVMLTQYKEENRVKCEPYMPLELKEPKQYGDIVVECLTYSSMNSFEYRTLKIRLGEKERTVKHFHFLSWRDYSANVQFDTMIDFIKKVRSFIQPPDVEGPMIVHCSAGVGRTGTYITIDHMIQHIDKNGTDSTVDIFNFVLKMRENRTTMVQTEQQYIFIHDCIKDYLDRFKTYENQAFNHEEENFYQNTEALELYQNVNFNSTQKTEL